MPTSPSHESSNTNNAKYHSSVEAYFVALRLSEMGPGRVCVGWLGTGSLSVRVWECQASLGPHVSEMMLQKFLGTPDLLGDSWGCSGTEPGAHVPLQQCTIDYRFWPVHL